MSNFIDLYLEHTKDYESPTSFWKWSAIITVAAALRDSLWLSDGDDKLYPNNYVLFMAGSGARKGRPVTFSEKLISKIHVTKIISGRASIEGILDELVRSETRPDNGQLVKGGSAIFYAPELASGIVESDTAISILTDIYDGKTNFSNVLRHSPKFKINDLVFSALMASNEEMCRNFLTERAKKGGFLARTLLIFQNEFRPSNSLTDSIPGVMELREKRLQCIVESLNKITKLSGQVLYSPKGKFRYDEWYRDFRNSYLRAGDPAGIAGRMHTHVKKVAMTLAANELSTELSETNIENAITLCVNLLPHYNTFIMTTGKSTVAEAAGIVIQTLLKAPNYTLSRKEILERHFNEFDSETLDKVTITLEGAGLLQCAAVVHGMSYTLTKRMIEKMQGEGKK